MGLTPDLLRVAKPRYTLPAPELTRTGHRLPFVPISHVAQSNLALMIFYEVTEMLEQEIYEVVTVEK